MSSVEEKRDLLRRGDKEQEYREEIRKRGKVPEPGRNSEEKKKDVSTEPGSIYPEDFICCHSNPNPSHLISLLLL